MNIKPCIDCNRPIAYNNQAPAGVLRHKSHGRCSACDNRTRKQANPYQPKTIDHLAIGFVVDEGLTMRLRPVERHIAVTLLARRGLSVPQIAARVGLSTRSVQRLCAQVRAAA